MAGAQGGVGGVLRVKLRLATKPLGLTADPTAGKPEPSSGLWTGLWLPEENGRALPIERERDAARTTSANWGEWGRNDTQ